MSNHDTRISMPCASNSFGMMTSREMLLNYVKNLRRNDLRKLLLPVRDGILTENTVLHMNTQNFSVDHVVVPITVHELLEELGPQWKKWIHTMTNEIPGLSANDAFDTNNIHQQNDDRAMSDSQILEYINDMNKYQKRSLLNLVRDGILTDECFINVSHGPERIQISMVRVVETLREAQKKELSLHSLKPTLLRIGMGKHYSSANFDQLYKSDLDVRSIPSARFTMPIWYTILFLMMTLGTFGSHIWSQATNYAGLQSTLNLTLPTIILVVSSLMIGLLLYLTIYMIGFLCCCETDMSRNGLITKDLNYGHIYIHFCELNQIDKRIYATKGIQFGLLWYTMVLAIYAHEYNLNIYPALICVLTNGFGLMLFARIAEFFRRCRRTRQGTAIAAR